MTDSAERLEPTEYSAAVEKIRPLSEGQLYSVLCHIAYSNPALVARAVDGAAAA